MESGTQLGRWRLLHRLGSGGNGDVWKCQSGSEVAALKILRRPKDHERSGQYRERFGRFKNEIEFLRGRGEVPGVVPLIDFSLPDDPNEPAWYVMPLATPLLKALRNDSDVRRVLDAVATIGGTLAALAGQGVAHRDIKPENLFQLNGEWAIGDFGLVAYPEQEHLTRHGRRVGPTDYMAPEMRESADTADPRAADVYSLAKTTWVLLTGQRYPLLGPHLPHVEGYALNRQLDFARATELDLLLERATDHRPTLRPTMAEFVKEIRAAMTEPPELLQFPNMAELQLRIANLTEQPAREEKWLGVFDRMMTSSFDALHNEAMVPVGEEVAANLPNFRRADDRDSLLAITQLPHSSDFRWHHGGAVTFLAPGPGSTVAATLAVGLRVRDDTGRCTLVALMRVGGAAPASNHRDVWLKVSEASLGSAQFDHALTEIANGLRVHVLEFVQTIAEFLAQARRG